MSDSQESGTLGTAQPCRVAIREGHLRASMVSNKQICSSVEDGSEISHTDFPQNQNWNEVVLRKTDFKDVIGNPGFCNLKILFAFHWLHMEFRLLVY